MQIVVPVQRRSYPACSTWQSCSRPSAFDNDQYCWDYVMHQHSSPWSMTQLRLSSALRSDVDMSQVNQGRLNKPGHRSIQPLRHMCCREEENLVFWFGAQFNSTLNFTQSGWLILFSPDLHFRLAKRVSCQTQSLRLETATRTDVPLVVPA